VSSAIELQGRSFAEIHHLAKTKWYKAIKQIVDLGLCVQDRRGGIAANPLASVTMLQPLVMPNAL
jgi:hypothetical protein